MAISNAFKGAYTNEVSQRNQTINTVTSGVKDLALLGLGIANVASGGALAGKMTQFVGRSLGGGAVMNLLNQKQASAQENQETKEMFSKEDVAGMLGDNPINRSAKKQLSTVFDKLAEFKQQGLINKKGQIESSLGEIDPKSELGKKILMEGE